MTEPAYRDDRFNIIDTDKVTLDVMEPYPKCYCLHCTVHEWSKDTFRELRDTWGGILEEFYKASIDDVYCLIPEEEEKIRKFATMFGFAPEYGIDYETDAGTTGTLVLYSFPVKSTIEEI